MGVNTAEVNSSINEILILTCSCNFPFSSISYTWLGSDLTKLGDRTIRRLESGLPSSEERNWYLIASNIRWQSLKRFQITFMAKANINVPLHLQCIAITWCLLFIMSTKQLLEVCHQLQWRSIVYSFYLLISYFSKLSIWICHLLFAINMILILRENFFILFVQ